MNTPRHISARGKPEILAPAGGRAQLEAAVWAGADAVYFGLDEGLNARVRAASIAAAELEATMGWMHERGVRGYLTLNTLVFDEELARAGELIRLAARAGVDALIVQDIGLLRLAREIAPGLPLHGSTQMSITDAEGVAFAEQLGVERVVIGRELSIDEIARVTAATRLGIEVFVHGALCVSYSGQCFSSEAWGGRSANRGQCAQACRLPYGLVVDGELQQRGDTSYLLSPQDLMALELLPRLVRAGVCSFKIEGRLKGPEYVIATVDAYRRALDQVWSNPDLAGETDATFTLDKAQRRRLAQVFSRGQSADHDGLTPGFLLGTQHQSLVIGRNPRHRGLLLGTVGDVTRRGVRVELHGPVKRGDGVVFDRGRPEQRETGGHVHHVIDAQGNSVAEEIDQGLVELVFAADFALSQIKPGQQIWRTRDSAQDAGTRLDPRLVARKVATDIVLSGQLGTPLTLILVDADGHSVTTNSDQPLQRASGSPLDEPRLRKAIGELGDTPLAIRRFTLDNTLLREPLFIPLSSIKTMRRDGVEQLLAMRRRHSRAQGLLERDPELLGSVSSIRATTPASEYSLSLLSRSREQVEAALAGDADVELVLDFLEVHGLKEACDAVRAAKRPLVVAAPRIFKPGEERLWRYYCKLAPDALLVRSTGLLQVLTRHGGAGAMIEDGIRIPPLHGDFSLNAANAHSAAWLLDNGLTRLTLTHDLNSAQIAALARALPDAQRDRVEVIVHHHLPIFHTEYCAFARFLSRGNSYRDCGRPCETHRLHLRDPSGGDHLVLADIGCRNTVFNAAAQSAGPVLNDLRAAGIRCFRIELVDEPAAAVTEIVAGYRALLDGHRSAASLEKMLQRVPDANGQRQGIGLGSLAIVNELPRAAMKKPTAR